jgi:dihydrofolate reductase
MSEAPKKRIIVAVSEPSWAIGLDNRIPWRHPGDMRRFKRLTVGDTVIMGRLTFESMNKKPLVDRRNIVVTRSAIDVPGIEVYPDLPSAVAASTGDVWFIGGRRIYEEAMAFADEIDVVFVPERIDDPRAVRFPAIDEAVFRPGPRVPHEDEAGLFRQVFMRVG